jgi:hypothetical protein
MILHAAIRIHHAQHLHDLLRCMADHPSPPLILSPPAAAARLGLGWWQAMLSLAPANWPLCLDCGPFPGLSMAAIRCQIPLFCAQLSPQHLQKIRQMAQQSNSRIITTPTTILDPYHHGSGLPGCLESLYP